MLLGLSVALGTVPVAGHHASRLDDPVRGEFRIDNPRSLGACAGYIAIDQIARQAQVLVGFENMSDCWLSPRQLKAATDTETLTGMSAREALDHLMTLMPEYSWREMNGVAVVRPKMKWDDPTDVLNFRAAAFRVTESPLGNALHRALQAVTPSVFHPHEDDETLRGPNGTLLSFVFPGGTMLDALNAIVRAHQSAEWQLGYGTNPARINLNTLTFSDSGVTAPVALPQGVVKTATDTRRGK
jgi:hypothetical protein